MEHLDWTGVPVDRRPETERRITILEAYLALENPAKSDRLHAMQHLGVKRAMFYRLLQTWSTARNPAVLAGAQVGRRGGRGGHRLKPRQEAIIGEVIARKDGREPPARIVREVKDRCAVARIKPPTDSTIKSRIREGKIGQRDRGGDANDTPLDLNLAEIPAGRRGEISRRIRVLDRFLSLPRPNAANRERAIKDLRLSRSMFYMLLTARKRARAASEFPGTAKSPMRTRKVRPAP